MLKTMPQGDGGFALRGAVTNHHLNYSGFLRGKVPCSAGRASDSGAANPTTTLLGMINSAYPSPVSQPRSCDFPFLAQPFPPFSATKIADSEIFASPEAQYRGAEASMSNTYSPKKWADLDDWERVKPVISRLYKDEGKTLKQVMIEMEKEHKFKAR